MIYISHRGNINGKNPDRENSPDYILDAIKKGYEVEVDVWMINNELYLGHDNPQYKINFKFFSDNFVFLWLHCKNLEILKYFVELQYQIIDNKSYLCIRYFWHQEDNFTLTSDNYIWTYPGQKLTSKSICVLPENANYTEEELYSCYGVCSDFIDNYKKSRT